MLTNCLAACTHVSSTVSQTFEPQVQKNAIFTYRRPHFCFTWLYGWKENAMLTNCIAACANISITVSEIQRYICEKIVILSYPLAFDAPIRGVPVGISAPPFGMEKLEWCRYPMVKKIRRYLYTFWRDPRTWRTDRRTDGQTLRDSKDRACIASRGKNRRFHVPQPTFLFPLETPLWQSRNMLHGWKDNSMLAKPLAACTYLSSIISELYDA